MTTPPPRLPSRSNSRRTSVAPYDAAEPDDTAITDVYRSVEETGSLEAAARKLHRLNSSTSSMSSTGGTPPVIAPLATRLPSKGPVWADDPEEAGYMNEQVIHEEDDGMMGDDDDDQARGSDDGEEEVVHMQEVMDGLWIGDLVAAMDVAGLERRGITNILSLLRPRLDFESQFATYPLEIDDTADTDILTHLPSCVAWISEALGKRQREKEEPNYARLPKPSRDKVIDKIAGETKPGGVLVHCQAGMSRSATVVLAYLMQTLSLEPVEALEILREKRPVVDPSDTFWYQLALFYNADGKVTLKDRSTRQFYMERTTSQFMNGDGGAPPLDKMAKFPATPTISNPPTPMGGHGRRKIRCKMCRRHLAVREHMMDHILDQAPISRPRTPSNFSLPSPRGSVSQVSPFTTVTEQDATITRRQSFVSDVINPLTGLPGATRRDSSASLAMTPTSGSFDNDSKDEPKLSPGGVPLPRTTTPGLTLTASSPEVHTGHKLPADVLPGKDVAQSPSAISPLTADNGPPIASRRAFQSADQLMSTLPPHLQALRNAGGGSMSALSSPFGTSPASSPEREVAPPFPASKGANVNSTYPPSGAKPAPISPPVRQSRSASQSGGVGGISVAIQDKQQSNPSPPEIGIVRSRSQSSSSNSGTIGRRMSLLAMTPTAAGFGQHQQTGGPGSRDRRQSSSGPNEGGTIATSGPPILVNPKCSGYFVEPLTWMEPFLRNGEISGKIVCPNEKCGVKIGNYDWAGVQCGCKEWVTPGFCISRSKVDEVW